MDETTGKEQNKRGKRKVGKWLLIFAVVILAGISGGAGYRLFNQQPQVQSKFEMDKNALEGFLPGKSDEDIKKELNRLIEKSRLNISMNPTPVIEKGKIDVMMENVPANNYYLQADVYIYTDKADTKMTQVYQSGVVKQGFYIESGDVLTTPAKGRYDGLAIFHAIYPDTMEEIGQAAMNLVVTVE